MECRDYKGIWAQEEGRGREGYAQDRQEGYEAQ